MTIHKDGLGTIAAIWLFCGLLIYLSLHFIAYQFISYPISAILIFFMIFVFFFFRVPKRHAAEGENVVTSVADGEVVIIEKVYEKEYIKGECIQVSVYMDFFNVHVNFWPISGEVTYYRYHPGKYLLAFLPKASELNEHTSVAVRKDCLLCEGRADGDQGDTVWNNQVRLAYRHVSSARERHQGQYRG